MSASIDPAWRGDFIGRYTSDGTPAHVGDARLQGTSFDPINFGDASWFMPLLPPATFPASGPDFLPGLRKDDAPEGGYCQILLDATESADNGPALEAPPATG